MQDVNASIITIGDELLIGQTIDTNSAFISQELNKIGIWVKRRISVGDDREEILKVLREQAEDCSVIIITGGLGPTADDITKPTLCEYFNTHLALNESVLENVKKIFTRLGKTVTERNRKQAEVPANCEVLHNARGTAPGMWFTTATAERHVIYISLPGVPHEMKGLITDAVIPRLKQSLTLPAVVHQTLLTAGKGESDVAEMLVAFEAQLPSHIRLAYLPDYGMVKLRLTGKGQDRALLESELAGYFDQLRAALSEWVVANEDVSVVQVLSDLLKKRGHTVSTAESCTGGYMAHLITSLAGSSGIFKGSIVAYANEVKENLLHVENEVLNTAGAVSEDTVRLMVQQVIVQMNTDYGIATSGIMGPDGGTPEKPVGTVWIAVGDKNHIKTARLHFRFDRMRNIQLTANAAINMLRQFILEEAGNSHQFAAVST